MILINHLFVEWFDIILNQIFIYLPVTVDLCFTRCGNKRIQQILIHQFPPFIPVQIKSAIKTIFGVAALFDREISGEC